MSLGPFAVLLFQSPGLFDVGVFDAFRRTSSHLVVWARGLVSSWC